MDELTRFARRLVEQLSSGREGVNRPVAVRLVREKLLPYRTHRRALQLDSVEDYETVLLRLVAGERGFVKTLPAEAARRCQDELAGANPDLGVLDEVAECTIQFTSLAAAQIVGDGEDGAPSEPKGALSTEGSAPLAAARPQGDPPAPQARRTAEIVTTPDVAPSRAKGPLSMERPSAPVASRPQGDTACPHCHHGMPAGRQVVFCPWCGQRLIPFTCARCQTELDSEWRHCITCGAPVKDPHRYE